MTDPLDKTNPINLLAEHVAGTRLEDIPVAAIGAAKTFLLDTLGVAIAGGGEDWGRRLPAVAADWGGAGGGEAAVWGTGMRLPAGNAALVNAYLVHCLEYDCVHEGGTVHALATILPAAMAFAEREGGIGGGDFLRALVLGMDTAGVMGISSKGPMTFFRPATVGVWGAAAALCALSGLDSEAAVNVFGNLYGQISGTLQPHLEGSPLLAMQMGFNARAALTALDLSRGGLRGPRDVLTGQYGYFALFEGGLHAADEVFATLGSQWQATHFSHKPFPAGRLTHGAVDALLRLREAHGLTPEEVERITVSVPPLVKRLVGRPDLPDPAPAYARLCLAFVAASALRRGRLDVPDYAPECLRDPETHALAARIEVVDNGNPDPNAIVPQHVEVRLRGGGSVEQEMLQVVGSPQAPFSPEENLAKFRRNWGYGAHRLDPEAGTRLIEMVERLETLADMRELTALMRP
ncbi:MAG: MmgE/PrpD family protein [SAR324 cluster bacterium]|nr:MmgE/PrpD family protein [SAR324 cluster bacterium]